MSVQPYRAKDTPCAIEKLFFDFDCEKDLNQAWKEAKVFAEALKAFYHVETLIVYSGRKGFHVYAFLNKLVYFDLGQLHLAKQAYGELQNRLVKGLNLHTLDNSVIGDIKRLSRVPFSIHEETGSLCCPITLDRKPYTPQSLDNYKTLDRKLLSPVIKDLKTREKIIALKSTRLPDSSKSFVKGIRPCIRKALQLPLEGANGHLMRLAIAREYLKAGYSIDEIVPLFRNQPDYSPLKTRYYVEHAQKNPAKPFKCRTIQRLGYCLGNSCQAKR
ncbi:MAG: DNA primase small subunit domain-containing protein [Candidatus Bathyarchaeales archaeon]